MIRFKATGDKIGSLVINPGGPGESGVEAAASLVGTHAGSRCASASTSSASTRAASRASTPAVWCNSDEDNDRLRADPQVDYTPEGVAHIESRDQGLRRSAASTRWARSSWPTSEPPSVVKDLDAMRAALGDEKLTYLGYSYGTRIGAAYAEAYPAERARDDPRRRRRPQRRPDRGRHPAGRRLPDRRSTTTPPTARKEPDCPLGTDPAKAVDVYKSLVDPLVENPAKTKDPRGLSYSDAIVGTILPLYSPNLWRHLTQALTELKDGRGDTMLALADLYMGRDADRATTTTRPTSGSRSTASTSRRSPTAPRVVDQDRRAREVGAVHELRRVHRQRAAGHLRVLAGAADHAAARDSRSTGLPPILVVSTTNDPATPYQAGVDLAKQLGGTLLTFDGTQHTVVFQGDTCVDDIAAKYLVDVVGAAAGHAAADDVAGHRRSPSGCRRIVAAHSVPRERVACEHDRHVAGGQAIAALLASCWLVAACSRRGIGVPRGRARLDVRTAPGRGGAAQVPRRRPAASRPRSAAPSRFPSTTRNPKAPKPNWRSSGCRPPATGSAC